MSVAQIIEEIPKLTREELALVAQCLADVQVGNGDGSSKTRTPGLGKGKWTVSDDFDDPLPNEFWLGEEK